MGKQGEVWLLKNDNTILRYKVTGWEEIDGALTDISIGAGGAVWGIGTGGSATSDKKVYKWVNNSWKKQGGATAVQIAVDPDGKAWRVKASGDIHYGDSQGWTKMPGKAKEIAVGQDGSVWSLGKKAVNSNGHAVFKWNADAERWDKAATGTLSWIAVAPNGQPWGVNPPGKIFRGGPNPTPVPVPLPQPKPAEVKETAISWKRVTGKDAKDIAIGAMGDAWIVEKGNGNKPLYYRAFQDNKWVKAANGTVKVAAGKDGEAWMLKSNGHIYKGGINGWDRIDGGLSDIAVGANGHVWGIGKTAKNANGNYIYKWNGSSWTRISGYAVQVAVSPDGTAWVVNKKGNIYKRAGTSWSKITEGEKAKAIEIGADGSVWRLDIEVNKDGNSSIYKWNTGTSSWEKHSGVAASLAIAPNGAPWRLNTFNQVLMVPLLVLLIIQSRKSRMPVPTVMRRKLTQHGRLMMPVEKSLVKMRRSRKK